MHVQSITMAVTPGFNRLTGRATVLIADASGKPVSGATVRGSWSGSVSSAGQGVTGTNGTVVITSPTLRRGRGNFTFQVTGVAHSGSTYNPAQNVVTSASIVY